MRLGTNKNIVRARLNLFFVRVDGPHAPMLIGGIGPTNKYRAFRAGSVGRGGAGEKPAEWVARVALSLRAHAFLVLMPPSATAVPPLVALALQGT